MATQELVTRLTSELKHTSAKLQSLTTTHSQRSSARSATTKEYNELQKVLNAKQSELQKLEQQLSKAGVDAKARTECETKIK